MAFQLLWGGHKDHGGSRLFAWRRKGIFVLMTGLLLTVVCIPIYRKIRKVKINDAFALVPFLAIGSYVAFLNLKGPINIGKAVL